MVIHKLYERIYIKKKGNARQDVNLSDEWCKIDLTCQFCISHEIYFTCPSGRELTVWKGEAPFKNINKEISISQSNPRKILEGESRKVLSVKFKTGQSDFFTSICPSWSDSVLL